MFDEYEVDGDRIMAAPYLLRGLERGLTEEDDQGITYYEPLEATPDLFLKFARLHNAADFEDAALQFAQKYGLPDGEERYPNPDGAGIDVEPTRWSLRKFREEVRRAWLILTLYETVLNGAAGRIERLFADEREAGGPFEDVAEIYSWVPKDDPNHRNFTLATGLRCAVAATEDVVQRLCRQQIDLSLHPDVPPGPSSCVGTSWLYDNLLGAMYLQMYWLLLAGADLVRCESCGSPIPLQSRPGQRKPPKHKRFCGDACRQAKHREKKQAPGA